MIFKVIKDFLHGGSTEPKRDGSRGFILKHRVNWLQKRVDGYTKYSGTIGTPIPGNPKYQAELDYLKEKYQSELGDYDKELKVEKQKQKALKKKAAQYMQHNQRTLEARQNEGNIYSHGPIAKQIVCPHCNTKGKVRKNRIELQEESREKGIIGASPIGRKTITKKGYATQLHCDNCDVTWTV